MKHLAEDELIELYYAEGTSAAKAHLQACRECSRKYAEFTRGLEEIRPTVVPLRGVDYGERVWQTLRPQLIPYEKKTVGWRGWAGWRVAAMAVGCAMVLAAVFFAGRFSKSPKRTEMVANPQAAQRVILVVLTDHLDRSERLLVTLEHADSRDRTDDAQMQSEARELLASNQLYRVTASNSGDSELAGALDRLEGVLAEIANDPNLTEADLNRVRKDMNTNGILFEIRVLQSRNQDQSTKGATI